MWLVVASALLVLVYVVLKPLGDGLADTSAWAAKVMACGSPQSKTHQEQCILKSSLISGPNFSVALNGQTRGTSS